MKNIALGRYIPYNSIIHKLDPRIKIAAMIGLFVIIFLPNLSLESYVLITILVFVLVKISGLKIKTMLKTLKVMWFMFFFLLIVNIFIRTSGDILVNINGFKVYSDAVISTFEIVLRMFLLISISTLLSATTKPLDLTYALEWYMHPLKKIKVPTHEIAMIISIALRFIPTILEDAQRIIKAQASRGVDLENGKLKEKLYGAISLIVPLFISAFDRSEELAFAMEARGYDPSAKRTRYRVYKFKIIDLLTVLIIAGLIVFFSYFKQVKIIPVENIWSNIKSLWEK